MSAYAYERVRVHVPIICLHVLYPSRLIQIDTHTAHTPCRCSWRRTNADQHTNTCTCCQCRSAMQRQSYLSVLYVHAHEYVYVRQCVHVSGNLTSRCRGCLRCLPLPRLGSLIPAKRRKKNKRPITRVRKPPPHTHASRVASGTKVLSCASNPARRYLMTLARSRNTTPLIMPRTC